MKKIIPLFSLITFIAFTASAQVPRFSKYQVNQTGRYAYFPSAPGTFDVTKSDDGSDVYTGEVEFEGTSYGLIMVDFTAGLNDESNKEDLGNLLTDYLDFLQSQFGIIESAGYGKGHTLESNPAATGMLDYWTDETGAPWVIKGWIDKKTLAVMFIYGTELPVQGAQDMFLNGFRFY